MNMLMVFAAAVDPVQSINNLAIAILGAGAALIMVVIVLKALGAISRGAVQALIGTILLGILLFMFVDGEKSIERMKSLAEGLAQIMGL